MNSSSPHGAADIGQREHEDHQADGSPPRPSTAPAGAHDSQDSGKTRTHPGTGEPSGGKPAAA